MNLPASHILPVDCLSGIFKKTTNSYKFYWFLAILESMRGDSELVIPVRSLLSKMISKVWYPVNYFNLSFGKQDRLGLIALQIKRESDLKGEAANSKIQNEVVRLLKQSSQKNLTANLNSLLRYVPYRFLRPWYSEVLRGLEDAKINSKIIQLANVGFKNAKNLPLYRFVSRQEECIEFPEAWFEYFQKHNKILTDFCLWNLLNYLQKNNPNVPNLPEKLFAPISRNMSRARKFWSFYLNQHSNVSCIYSNIVLSEEKFSVDHFIPWKFVTHDLLWNLIPVPKFINSRKSDSLPALQKYFEGFTKLQFDAFRTIYQAQRFKLLEDYSNLYHCELETIFEMPFQKFRQRLYATISPLVQIAQNMGYKSNWVYK